MGETIELWKPKPGYDLALQPCPFCGGKEIVYEKYLSVSGERWRVWCTQCLAGIDPGYAQERHQVQKMWNRRV